MLPGAFVHHAVAAAAVVAHHATNHGPVGCAGFGAKKQAVGLQKHVELIADDARLHPHPMFVFVQFQYLGKMLAHIYHNAIAHHLTRQAGAGRAWDERRFVLVGKTNERLQVFVVFGDGDGQGHFAVGRCIGGIQHPHGLIGI